MTPRLRYDGLSDVGGNLARQNEEIFAEHLMNCVESGMTQREAVVTLTGTFEDAAYLEMEYAEEICPRAMFGMVELGHTDYVETFAHFDGRAFVQANWDAFKAAHESADRPRTRPPTPVEMAKAAGRSSCTKPKTKPKSKATASKCLKKKTTTASKPKSKPKTSSNQRKPKTNGRRR